MHGSPRQAGGTRLPPAQGSPPLLGSLGESLLNVSRLQGDDPEVTWTLHVISCFFQLLHGMWATVMSVAWILNVMLYHLPERPISLVLNKFIVFSSNQDAVAYFLNVVDLLFCILLTHHLIACASSGLTTIQEIVPFLPVSSHPSRPPSAVGLSVLGVGGKLVPLSLGLPHPPPLHLDSGQVTCNSWESLVAGSVSGGADTAEFPSDLL